MNVIREFIEKPKETIAGAYACGGIFVLNKRFLSILEEEDSMGKALEKFVKLHKVLAAIWSGWWVDLGYPWDILRAIYHKLESIDKNIISKKASISHSVTIDGPVIIEDDVIIDHYTVLKGPLYLGKGVSIGSHTMIRAFVDIEEDSSIHSYSEIVWSNLQPKVTVGRNSYLGFSVIGEESVIEPNVITKTLVQFEEGIVKPIEIIRKHQRYLKLGAFIGTKIRVKTGSILEPGIFIG